MKYSLATIVKNYANFQYIRNGNAYYSIVIDDEILKDVVTTYLFPVEIADLGTAALKSCEKGLLLMRYIRKALENGKLVIK